MTLNSDGSRNRDKHGFDAPVAVDHPARTNIPDSHPAGPAIGELMPDFALPNAEGDIVEFHKDRAGAKSAVVFYRSAVW